jgi:hypothetical protein
MIFDWLVFRIAATKGMTILAMLLLGQNDEPPLQLSAGMTESAPKLAQELPDGGINWRAPENGCFPRQARR